MAEDQTSKGDKWTTEVSNLLEKLGWKKVADSNIDIKGAGGNMHGIDSLFTYEDGYLGREQQGVFIEAKAYKTTSFGKKKLSGWVETLDKKIRELKFSESFQKKYPLMSLSDNRNGLLVIWFDDIENYPNFREKFLEALNEVKVPKARKPTYINRLFVIDNTIIKRLCSIIDCLRIRKDEVQNEGETDFYYSSSIGHAYPAVSSSILNLEYFFSKFIFAKSSETHENLLVDCDIVFYFGDLDLDSFFRLRQALILHNMINKDNLLYLYIYQHEPDEFRKITPDINTVFSEDCKKVLIKQMTKFERLPEWITKKIY